MPEKNLKFFLVIEYIIIKVHTINTIFFLTYDECFMAQSVFAHSCGQANANSCAHFHMLIHLTMLIQARSNHTLSHNNDVLTSWRPTQKSQNSPKKTETLVSHPKEPKLWMDTRFFAKFAWSYFLTKTVSPSNHDF